MNFTLFWEILFHYQDVFKCLPIILYIGVFNTCHFQEQKQRLISFKRLQQVLLYHTKFYVARWECSEWLMIYWKTVARSSINHRPRLMTLTLPHITKTLSLYSVGFVKQHSLQILFRTIFAAINVWLFMVCYLRDPSNRASNQQLFRGAFGKLRYIAPFLRKYRIGCKTWHLLIKSQCY